MCQIGLARNISRQLCQTQQQIMDSDAIQVGESVFHLDFELIDMLSDFHPLPLYVRGAQDQLPRS
jgi:hypothetical protein